MRQARSLSWRPRAGNRDNSAATPANVAARAYRAWCAPGRWCFVPPASDNSVAGDDQITWATTFSAGLRFRRLRGGLRSVHARRAHACCYRPLACVVQAHEAAERQRPVHPVQRGHIAGIVNARPDGFTRLPTTTLPPPLTGGPPPPGRAARSGRTAPMGRAAAVSLLPSTCTASELDIEAVTCGLAG